MTQPLGTPGGSPLGIIGGSAFLEAGELAGAELREIQTARGSAHVHVGSDFVFLRRHGEGVYHPPHRINHHAHALAFESFGVKRVAAFCSTGSMRDEIAPGHLVIPDDYLSYQPPPTFAEDEYLHIVPRLDQDVRAMLREAAERTASARAAESGTLTPLVTEGVYLQTPGPRFETAAEVRMLAPHTHVVGMTGASEATLCQERGLGYAMICTIDNWANGIGATPLTLELFQANLVNSAVLARQILGQLLALWREGGS
jgi:5'-methylthioadenosine phosphorylase